MPEAGASAKPAAGRAGPAPVSGREVGGDLALGFDFGTERIGVAVGSAVTATARPLCVIAADGKRRWDAIASLIQQWQPATLVVGIARHPDGKAHEMTGRCERFARQLKGRFGLA